MHALTVRVLESLLQRLRHASVRKQRAVIKKLLTRALLVVDLDKDFRLRSPRRYLKKHHFPDVSFWSHAKSLPDDKADDAYMAFLNLPCFAFEELAAHVRPHFPEYDPDVVKPKGGRPSTVDFRDLTAIGLRALRVMGGQEYLGFDFQMTQPAISKALKKIRPVIAHIARTHDAAKVCLPTLDEARAMWATLIAQHGISDEVKEAFEGLVFALSCDGVAKPMLDCSNVAESRLWNNANKGRCMNNLLLWSVWGLICNYSVGWKGATHDSHAAEAIFAELQDPLFNPGRIGAFVDTVS